MIHQYYICIIVEPMAWFSQRSYPPHDPQQQVVLQAPEPPEAPVPEAAQASSQQVGVLKSRFFFSENDGKTMEKPWKNHGTTMKMMEKPWKNHENDGKTMEKPHKYEGF